MNVSNVFKYSFFGRIVIYIADIFSRAYNGSALKKAVNFVRSCFLSSAFFGLLSRYANKKAFYRYSLIYKFVMAVSRLFDRLFGFLHKLVASWLKGSVCASNIGAGINSSLKAKLIGFGVLCIGISAGSAAALFILGSMSTANALMCLCSLVLGLILMLCGAFDEALRQCFLVRGVKAFLNVLK